MTKNYIVINDGKLIIENWRGEISHEEIASQQKRKLLDQSISKNAVILADLRYSTMSQTSIENIQNIVDTHTNSNNTASVKKIILIVPNPELFEKATHFRASMG